MQYEQVAAFMWVSSWSSIGSNNILKLHSTKTSTSKFIIQPFKQTIIAWLIRHSNIDFIDQFCISNKNVIFCSFSTEMSHLIYADSDSIQSLQFNFGNRFSAIVSHVKYEIQSTMFRFVVQIAWNQCRWAISPFNRVCKLTLCYRHTHKPHTQAGRQTYKYFVVIFD